MTRVPNATTQKQGKLNFHLQKKVENSYRFFFVLFEARIELHKFLSENISTESKYTPLQKPKQAKYALLEIDLKNM